MILKNFLSVWLPLALRFVVRHRRKTIATGSFIVVGTMVLVLINAMTVGVNDTMVLNTTHLHFGHSFLDVPSETFEVDTARKHVLSMHDVDDVLLRYRFSSIVIGSAGSVPMVIYAVEPEKESARTAISKRIINGRYPAEGKDEILLGSTGSRRSGSKVGDKVDLYIDISDRTGTYTVSGIYETGIDRYDEGIAFIPSSQLSEKDKAGMDAELSVFFPVTADIMAETQMINRHLPPEQGFARWDEMLPDLVQLVDMNEVSMRIIMILVFGLVGFGISNNFILTTVERFREFGILKAMGVTPRELVFLVFLESFMICIAAAAAGLVVGWALTGIIAQFGIDLSHFTSHNRYFVVSGIIYPRITAAGLYWPAMIAVFTSLVASYLPARIVSRKITAETLRFS
ncbi:MAG: ABC transporter permease [Nitrospirota bacterium]|nr:MAG: ABC transporter permease [Nitrospirota bacterium]